MNCNSFARWSKWASMPWLWRGEEGRGGEGRRGEGGEGRGEVCTWAEFKCRADQTLQQPHNQDIHEDKAVVDWL